MDNRKRNFVTIVYPESAPLDWKELIINTHIPCFISPLHDKDLNPDGEPKKAHYHVLLKYEGKKDPEEVRRFCESFGGVGMEVVNSIRGYARYLCHLDNPEKAQYSVENVISYSGADYFDTISLPSDRYALIGDMMDFCSREHCYTLRSLSDYARENREDWFRLLCDNAAFIMREYIKSLYWEEKGDM